MTKIEKLRKEKNISRRQLAFKAGVSPDTIMRIEHREAMGNVRLMTYQKIAQALGTDTVNVIEDDYLYYSESE